MSDPTAKYVKVRQEVLAREINALEFDIGVLDTLKEQVVTSLSEKKEQLETSKRDEIDRLRTVANKKEKTDD